MVYTLEIEKNCEDEIKRLVKKNKFLEIALTRAIERIVLNPHQFKPLRWPLNNFRRVHVAGSFVLVYKILENEKKIRLFRFAHHDEAYKF